MNQRALLGPETEIASTETLGVQPPYTSLPPSGGTRDQTGLRRQSLQNGNITRVETFGDFHRNFGKAGVQRPK
jgi:hypothetical protein